MKTTPESLQISQPWSTKLPLSYFMEMLSFSYTSFPPGPHESLTNDTSTTHRET